MWVIILIEDVIGDQNRGAKLGPWLRQTDTAGVFLGHLNHRRQCLASVPGFVEEETELSPYWSLGNSCCWKVHSRQK